MWTAWLVATIATAGAADTLTLGKGRMAVLEPGVVPTSVTVANPRVLVVSTAAPYLLIGGGVAGSTTLVVSHDGGQRTWAVTVDASPKMAPTGAGLLDLPSPEIGLAPYGGALMPSEGTVGVSIGNGDVVQVAEAGSAHYWVQGGGAGLTDLLVERSSGPPLRYTVSVASGGGTGTLPRGWSRPTAELWVPRGGVTRLQMPCSSPAAFLVGHPSRLRAEPVGAELNLTGLRTGATNVVIACGDHTPWARSVVVGEP